MNLYKTSNDNTSKILEEPPPIEQSEEYLIKSNEGLKDLTSVEEQEVLRLENLMMKKAFAISNENFKTLKEEQLLRLSEMKKCLLILLNKTEALQKSNSILASNFDKAIHDTLSTALTPNLKDFGDTIETTTNAFSRTLDELQKKLFSYYEHRQTIDLAILVMTVCSLLMSGTALLKIMLSN